MFVIVVVVMTTTRPKSADLTPFGFTPTETSVYFALLERGPASGYAIARDLSVARANVYQALHGLVAKRAAVVVEGDATRFQAVRPASLYAQIVEQQATMLDRLEASLHEVPRAGVEPIVSLTGRRALLDLMTRVGARETGPVLFLGQHAVMAALAPMLRKRAADRTESEVWLIGTSGDLPVPVAGVVAEDRVREFLPADTVVMLAPGGVLVGRMREGDASGFWSGDESLVGTARAALGALTAAGSS